MPNSRLQYQILAEPVSTSPEVVSADRWEPTYPDRLNRAPALISAIVAGALFFVAPNLPQIPQTPQNQPARSAARSTALGEYSVDPTQLLAHERITPDKWEPTYPDRINPLRRPVAEGVSIVDTLQLTQHERITPDKWLPLTPDRIPGIPRPVHLWPSFFSIVNAPVPADAATLNVYPDRLDRLRGLGTAQQQSFATDALSLTAHERITPDKWEPVYPDRISRPTSQPHLLAATTGDIKLQPPLAGLTVDKWLGNYPDRITRPFSQPHLLAASVSDGVPRKEAVSLDRWQPSYPDRLHRPALPVAHQAAFTAPLNPTVASVDGWIGSHPVSINRNVRQPHLLAGDTGDLKVQPNVPVIPLDRWHPEYPDRIVRAFSRPHLLPCSVSDGVPRKEAVSLDRWLCIYPNQIPTRISGVHLIPADSECFVITSAGIQPPPPPPNPPVFFTGSLMKTLTDNDVIKRSGNTFTRGNLTDIKPSGTIKKV